MQISDFGSELVAAPVSIRGKAYNATALSDLVATAAAAAFDTPTPPRLKLGDKEEEQPRHPEYVKATREWNANVEAAQAVLMLGITEPKGEKVGTSAWQTWLRAQATELRTTLAGDEIERILAVVRKALRKDLVEAAEKK